MDLGVPSQEGALKCATQQLASFQPWLSSLQTVANDVAESVAQAILYILIRKRPCLDTQNLEPLNPIQA
jgi:hypothetical protein